MKSIGEIRSLAEKEFPYNPYDEALFNGFRTAKIEGFIKGYQKSQYTLEDLRKSFDAGRNVRDFASFEEFMNTFK